MLYCKGSKAWGETVSSGYLDPKYRLYKLCDSPKNYFRSTGLTALIAQTDDISQIWHDQLRHLKFQILKMMVTNNMVTDIPTTIPPDGVFRGCVLGKHN